MRKILRYLAAAIIGAAAVFATAAVLQAGDQIRTEWDALPPDIGQLPPEQAFDILCGTDAVHNHDLLREGILRAFGSRPVQGIMLALQALRLPEASRSGDTIVRRTNEHFVARTILQVFPAEAAPYLDSALSARDAANRADLIRVLGTIPGDSITRHLLQALNDLTAADEEDEESMGSPLRICDLAYNQLVLRYRVDKVLRTIGPAHRTEVRDYHIRILRNRLASRAGEPPVMPE